jgi:hypothetical protein
VNCILELVVQAHDSLEHDRIRPASMFEVVCALHDDMNNVRQNGVEIESTKFASSTRAFFDARLECGLGTSTGVGTSGLSWSGSDYQH